MIFALRTAHNIQTLLKLDLGTRVCDNQHSRTSLSSINVSDIAGEERSGSVVECLTRDLGATGSSLTSVTALWSLSKTHLS